MKKKSENCRVPRWEILKGELKNLSAAEARTFVANHPSLTVIDCRKPTEAAELRLPKALNIDYLAYDFWATISQLSKEHDYLVYCNSGRRSARVCTLMKNGGFRSVYNLSGGLREWVEELGDEGLLRHSSTIF